MADPVQSFVLSGPQGSMQPPTTVGFRSPFVSAGGKLFRQLASSEKGNIVMSPMSVLVALGMASAGSSDGSKTQSELKHFLKHHDLGPTEDDVHKQIFKILTGVRGADAGVDLTVANSLWAEQGVLDAFRDVCARSFAAEVRPLAGPAEVNEWVSAATKGLIPSILSERPLGPAVLVNAVHFKAAWSASFKPELTEKAAFRPFEGPEVECMLMKKDDKKTRMAETPTAQVVVLPYGSTQRFVAALVLPNEEGHEALDTVAHELLVGDEGGEQDGRLERLVEAAEPRHVVTFLPRFKISFGPTSLKGTLQSLGVREAFEPSGEFLRLSPDPSAYIKDVLHKAVMEVNEEGTTAAAATAVVMTRSLSFPAVVRADRPFLFVVLDTAPDGAGGA
eukprot:CAMPEP_0113676912 /NCGR_PEP_ID=MMETSP0038_2-20120614/8935_1 /TAXON_ID=2898 /ORGANISM="Cryptomonas paramecium" /LENGTH=390 /DNA_ID=CAMNT_0000594051 /DNA_START=199 /DNA_END=1368 /DNA_ORIENTATION=- /assembly_acc=CAM_ASM_000170